MDSTLIDDITSLTRRMRTIFDNMVKEKGLTLARARILRLLKRSGSGATQSALATELEIEGPTLVRLLDNLESLGWIERQAEANGCGRCAAFSTTRCFRRAPSRLARCCPTIAP